MSAEEIFKQIQDSELLLTYFSQPECSVCTVLRPKVQELAGHYHVPFLYINTHETPLVSGQFLVFAVPTIVLFQNGREVTRWSRALGVEQIESTLQRILP